MTTKSPRGAAEPPANHSPESGGVVIQLNAEESLAFAQALLNPREPDERMRAAARRYREIFGDGGA